ncbi:MAG: NADH-ubiquinone oxidoreductase-F iron-sulfur binding region domain-containing protein [Chloroflexota bacterium]
MSALPAEGTWTGVDGADRSRKPALAGLPRLLAGPPIGSGAESLAQHVARLGAAPSPASDSDRWALVSMLERSGLRGRGGAAFPLGTKWRSVANQARAAGRAEVLANGAEGEPASAKDRTLLALRPHLVLDGAILAAEVIGAGEVTLYVGREMRAARQAIEKALRERRAAGMKGPRTRIVDAPDRYVAGEESAAVHRVNGGPAKPTFVPPRPFERGIHGAPTLVQNVESLAQAALVARFGDAWFRELGTRTSPGSTLMTMCGAVARPGVLEVPLGLTLGEVAEQAGGMNGAPQAVLMGGYFGKWLPAAKAWPMPLDYEALRAAGTGLGCGAVLVLPPGCCGLAEGARILQYLAEESAGQCGPCLYGLDALSDAFWRIAFERGRPADRAQIERWAAQIAGRGACHHPDGAIGMLRSCLETFAGELADHLRRGPCSNSQRAEPVAPIPSARKGWR